MENGSISPPMVSHQSSAGGDNNLPLSPVAIVDVYRPSSATLPLARAAKHVTELREAKRRKPDIPRFSPSPTRREIVLHAEKQCTTLTTDQLVYLTKEERKRYLTKLKRIQQQQTNKFVEFAGRGDLTSLKRLYYGLSHNEWVSVLFNWPSTFGCTALSEASAGGHTAVVKYLLEQKSNPNVANKNGATPVHCAAQYGSVQTLALLVESKADVNKANAMKDTPLIVAAYNGQISSVRLLVEDARADVGAKGDEGMTASEWALKEGHSAVVSYLNNAANMQYSNVRRWRLGALRMPGAINRPVPVATQQHPGRGDQMLVGPRRGVPAQNALKR